MTRATLAALATALTSLLAQACSGGATSPHAGSGQDSGTAARTYAPTWTAVYGEILSLRCAQPFCHLGAAGAPMPLSSAAEAYQQLVGVPPSGALSKCLDAGGGMLRVDPGHLDTSLLYLKVVTPVPAGLCGDTMPGGGQPGLDARDVAQIQQWIMQGAMNN